MSAICIIPARGGSRRIPRKNIKPFFGKPIITYSIKTALESDLFDWIGVSTDDEEIGSIATAAGAQVLWRPAELCHDEVGTQEVAKHALGGLLTADRYACVIYPCAPLLQPVELHVAFNMLETDPSVQYCVSVGTEPLRDAGCFYFGRIDAFARGFPLYWHRTVLYPMPESRVCDINTPEDWARAEALYREYEGIE